MIAFLIFISVPDCQCIPSRRKTVRLQLVIRMVPRILALAVFASLAWGQALEEAKRAFDKGDFAAAARLFEQAHQASRRAARFCSIWDWRDTGSKKPDAALIAFRSAVECDPKLLPAHLAHRRGLQRTAQRPGGIGGLRSRAEPGSEECRGAERRGEHVSEESGRREGCRTVETLAAVSAWRCGCSRRPGGRLAAFGDRAARRRSSFRSLSKSGRTTPPH